MAARKAQAASQAQLAPHIDDLLAQAAAEEEDLQRLHEAAEKSAKQILSGASVGEAEVHEGGSKLDGEEFDEAALMRELNDDGFVGGDEDEELRKLSAEAGLDDADEAELRQLEDEEGDEAPGEEPKSQAEKPQTLQPLGSSAAPQRVTLSQPLPAARPSPPGPAPPKSDESKKAALPPGGSSGGRGGPAATGTSHVSGQEAINVIQRRIQEYHNNAKHFKRAGDDRVTRMCLLHVKRMKELVAKLQSGGAVAKADIPPSLPIGSVPEPPAPQAGAPRLAAISRPSGKSTVAAANARSQPKLQRMSSDEALLLQAEHARGAKSYAASLPPLAKDAGALAPKDIVVYDTLVKKLDTEIDELHGKALEALAKKDRELAVSLLRQRREAERVRELLVAAHARGFKPPSYKPAIKVVMQELAFPSIPADHMEITIMEAAQLTTSANYVRLSFDYPSAEKPFTQKTARVKAGTELKFAEKFLVPFNPRVRQGELQAKRLASMKVKLAVMRSGLLSDGQVAATELKLEAALHRAEFEEALPLRAEDSRKPAGTLRVLVRLSSPLVGRDVRPVPMQTVEIDESTIGAHSVTHAAAASAARNALESAPIPRSEEEAEEKKSVSPQPPQRPVNEADAPSRQALAGEPRTETPRGGSTPAASRPAAKAQPASAPAAKPAVLDAMIKVPLDAPQMTSNEVLEFEIRTCKARITKLEDARKKCSDDAQLEQLSEAILREERRLSELEARMQTIVDAVQKNLLSIKDYLEQLKSEMAFRKKAEARLRAAGQDKAAEYHKKLHDIMAKEVEEAEANIDQL